MQLSVIIPCLNGADTIANQLEALAAQQWCGKWEVIFADNGSTDNSVAIVERYKGRLPALRIVDASDQRGAAHARNVGASLARGDALAFCDADDEVAPGWVSAMGNALMQHDFVCCRLEVEKLNELWVRKARGAPQQHEVPTFSYPPYLSQAGAGTIGVKRALHRAVGGFDEFLPAHEDTDYCFKLQLRGVRLHFVPDAVLHVRYRDHFWGIFNQARIWGKYHVFLYKRYRPLGMPRLSLKTGISAWKDLLRELPRIHSKASLSPWLCQFAWRFGRLQGCIRYRVLAL